MDVHAKTLALKHEAHSLGFELTGVVPAIASAELPRLQDWLTDGCAADMHFIADRLDAYASPQSILPGAKSILMLAANYRTEEPAQPKPGEAILARYAWGTDYHEVIHQRLRKLVTFHSSLFPDEKARGVVDTAPLLERDYARQAGLGWIGKNTLLINRRFGSWLFLTALLSTASLEYDETEVAEACGSCRACLDACPTGALGSPYRVDARKCLSYLSVEHRGPIPEEFQSSWGKSLFGCDACQTACPWNQKTESTSEKEFWPRAGMNPIDLTELQALDDETFRKRFRKTALLRSKHEGILRNAAIVKFQTTIKPS